MIFLQFFLFLQFESTPSELWELCVAFLKEFLNLKMLEESRFWPTRWRTRTRRRRRSLRPPDFLLRWPRPGSRTTAASKDSHRTSKTSSFRWQVNPFFYKLIFYDFFDDKSKQLASILDYCIVLCLFSCFNVRVFLINKPFVSFFSLK